MFLFVVENTAVSCATFVRNWKAGSLGGCAECFSKCSNYTFTTLETRNHFYSTRGTPAHIRLVLWSCAKSVSQWRRRTTTAVVTRRRDSQNKDAARDDAAAPTSSWHLCHLLTHSGVTSLWIPCYLDCIVSFASFSVVGFSVKTHLSRITLDILLCRSLFIKILINLRKF